MYDHKQIERKWQQFWQTHKVFETTEKHYQKFYVLDMFPYPSGQGLHVGHPLGYTATDIVARMKRMQNYDVLHPIGWDAFGLPAEQYALQTGNHPHDFTQKNIANFRRQLQKLGFSYDYDKEIDTTDPKFYKWTQHIFRLLYQKGLASLEEVEVNFCPQLGTVLANEEVIYDANQNRVSERGNFPVYLKKMKQWVLKITNYASDLLDGLETVNFPSSLKLLQKKWIGKTDGFLIRTPVFIDKQKISEIEVFLQDLHLIYGIAAVILPYNFPNINEIVSKQKQYAVSQFIQAMEQKTDLEIQSNPDKSGIFIGSYALNLKTQLKVPIFVTNFLLKDQTGGALFAIPAHNQDSYTFAKNTKIKFHSVLKTIQKLPINQDYPLINSLELDGLKAEKAKKIVLNFLENKRAIKPVTKLKLKDWIFSRQRYWGEPFPIYYSEFGDVVVDKNLVELPFLEKIVPGKAGESPLVHAKNWKFFLDGMYFHRDLNTMPQWAGSSWYFLAYILKQKDGSYLDLDSPAAYEKFQKWMPVDLYIGGQEHAVSHLLYARFWNKFLYDEKIVPYPEPFKKIIHQGMILGPDNQKMSKSKGNVINPDEIVDQFGADALRIYLMFLGPLSHKKAWKNSGPAGIKKWLDRVWRMVEFFIKNEFVFDEKISFEEDSHYHRFIINTHINLETQFKPNLVVASMMTFVNEVYKIKKLQTKKQLVNFLLVLSLFAPHIAEELLEKLGEKPLHFHEFPKPEKQKTKKNIKMVLPIQINGKLRGFYTHYPQENSDEFLEKDVLENPVVKKYLKGAKPKKIIYVPHKVISIILGKESK